MRWTSGRMVLVTAVGFLALVAAGITFVVHTPAEQTSLTGASATGGRHSAPRLPTVSGPPATIVTPGPEVTMSAAPSSAPSTTPSTTPSPRSTPTPSPRSTPKPRPEPSPSLRPIRSTPRPKPIPPPILDFELSSFNVLGASHKRPGKASGRVRAGHVVDLLRRHGSDVVGFQELQGVQLAVLKRRTGMDFYPGFSLGRLGTDNSIGWRRDSWVPVEKHTVAIPYFSGGRRAMPYVKLRNRDTGIEAWFANFHNPAETSKFRDQQRFRSKATSIEIALANRLITTSGLPVFITGDMNERSSYFCRFTAGTPMVAARGGTNNGRCRAGRPRAVDWIFGSQGVDFTGYFEDRSHLVDITTDHPVIVARVHLVGRSPGTSN